MAYTNHVDKGLEIYAVYRTLPPLRLQYVCLLFVVDEAGNIAKDSKKIVYFNDCMKFQVDMI